MHPSPLLLASDVFTSLAPAQSFENIADSPSIEAAAFVKLRAGMGEYLQQPDSIELRNQFLTDRRIAAEAISRISRKETDSAFTHEARALVREVTASGIQDRPVNAEDHALACRLVRKDWQGMLAAMLLVPAWQWTDAPNLVSVPDWLRVDFVDWLFAPPQGFSELGQAELYGTYVLGRLEELLRWVNRGPGADAEFEVLTAFATKSSVIPLYFSKGSLRRHAELRGRLLTRGFAMQGKHDLTAPSRFGRKLRVGMVNRHFGPQTETYTTLPTFEHLDPERFEVILFAHRAGETRLEEHCRKHATDFRLLPDALEEQIEMLRTAALDVVVFGTNITAVFNEVTRLALHRVAPLQVVNNSSCITSGLPEIDLYVSGSLTETAHSPDQFSERLGLLPGPTHAFNYSADREDAQVPCTRADFGIPEDAFVFVSAANYFKIIPEMQHAWAKLLASVPGSCLLLHPFNPNWVSDYPILRFRVEFARVLELNGVDGSRLAVSTLNFPSRTDVKTLLGLGNVYLDTFPFGGVNSLIDPLELALPVVAWEGDTFRSRMGAALLRQLELPHLVAVNRDDYLAIAEKLATDAALRAECGAAIRSRMDRGPVFLDSLAASEAFGDLIETAYDELAEVGREAFRAAREPLVAAPARATEELDEVAIARATLRRCPADAGARHVLGRALLEAGRSNRAVAYLLGALQGEEAKAEVWLDTARALKADGQLNEALQALEAGLRLDQSALEGWVLFAELAHTLGSTEIAREAAGVAQQLAPGDTRVLAYL